VKPVPGIYCSISYRYGQWSTVCPFGRKPNLH